MDIIGVKAGEREELKNVTGLDTTSKKEPA